MIGRTLSGIYRVSELVGSGGFADVYLGRDLRSNTVVAVKILHDNFADDPALVRRFLREAQLAQSLVEPHVVRVLDAGQEGDTYFLIMEFVQGHTLAHLIQSRGPLPVDEAIGYVCQVLQALAAAHQGGIIHRDIKPVNLMVTPGGLVKVMDFGIAKRTAVETMAQTTMYLGTPRYMSPEQAKGGHATAQSDIYAVSITLYELLAGRTPFSAETPWQMLNLHMLAEPPPIRAFCSDVPPAVEQILARGLKKNPSQRFGSADEMLQALREALPENEQRPEIFLDQNATLSAPTVQGTIITPTPETDRPEQSSARDRQPPEEITGPLRPIVAPTVNRDDPIGASSSQQNGASAKVVGEKSAASPKRRISPFVLIAGGTFAVLVFLFVLGSIVGPTPTPTPASTSVTSPIPTSQSTAVLTLATSAPATPASTATPSTVSPTAQSVEELLSRIYLDTFKDPTSGFPPHLIVNGVDEGGYADGTYQMTLTDTKPSSAAVFNTKHTFGDFSFTIAAHVRDTTPNGSYGVLFRLQDISNCYQFSVDPNLGEYGLFKRQNNEVSELVKWTSSPAIKRGTATNYLRVVAQGHSLAVSVNGTALATVEDATFAHGHVGMRVDSWSQPISASFSVLTILPPPK